MTDMKRVCKTEEVPSGSMKAFDIGYERVLICHTESGFYAMEDKCSHDSAPISSGHIENGHIVCPRHGAKFEITTGEVKAPPAIVGVDTYELKIENDEIFINME